MPEYADLCLAALVAAGLGHTISLGDALGLLHYLDYRTTHDVDAWWLEPITSQEREQVAGVIEVTLQPFGAVRRRVWGDVLSIELAPGGRAEFSFQIAERSVQLQPAEPVPGTGLLIDSLADLVASKMVALVERGAPRDFRDIHAVCHAGLMTPSQCWQLWQERQLLAGSDTDRERARLAMESHLARIAVHRPLEQIADKAERTAAAQLRRWFHGEFLDALLA